MRKRIGEEAHKIPSLHVATYIRQEIYLFSLRNLLVNNNQLTLMSIIGVKQCNKEFIIQLSSTGRGRGNPTPSVYYTVIEQGRVGYCKLSQVSDN